MTSEAVMTIRRPSPDDWSRNELFLGGEWRACEGSAPIVVNDCATEEVIGSVGAASAAHLDEAVQAARAAQPAWAASGPDERARLLRAWHDALIGRIPDMTALISAEVGTATRICSRVQVESALSLLSTITDLLPSFPFEETINQSLVAKEASGVAAAITPWNYPLFQSMGKIAAALASGCTVVHKPSSLAPLSAVVMAEAAATALPAGTYNLLTGRGQTIGDGLVSHPGVDVVSFTGSTSVGARIYELAARSIKRVALELGGKSASVLLADASLDAAVRTSVNRAFLNSGQTCDAWTRLLVPRNRLTDVLDLVVATTSRLTLGDPFDDATRLGPLISREQAERVREYIRGAVREGAAVITGGAERPAGLEKGHYVSPTVLSDVTPSMTVAQEEIFGPVLVVMRYESEDQALDLANATDYGLSGAVWSADSERAMTFARGMSAGQVVINGGGFDPSLPFGGVKRSGVGRELGRHGLEEYLETKAYVR